MRLQESVIKESASRTTELQESLFAVAFGISQINRGPITRQMIMNGDLFTKSFDTFVKTGATSDAIYIFAGENSGWVDSVVKSVNELRKHPFVNKTYTIYRGVGLMKQIYDAKTVLIAKQGTKLTDDKWNPGDIWLSASNTLPNFENINGLNDYIRVQLEKGNLISVSLKKSNNPKVTYVKQDSDNVTQYKFKGIRKPRTPFNTGITMLTDNPKLTINLRSFSIKTKQNIISEILLKGSGARHGKARVDLIIKKYKIYQTYPTIISKRVLDDDLDGLAKDVVSLWKDAGHDFTTKYQKDWDKFKTGKFSGNKVGYFKSIMNSLEFGVYLTRHKAAADDIITELMRQGSSQNELSSDFLKIA